MMVQEIETMNDHYLAEAHVWVGCTPLPSDKRGRKEQCKHSPGQLGCTYDGLGGLTSFVIDDCSGGCIGDELWIAIHAVTCELVCSSNVNPMLADETPPTIENERSEAVPSTTLSDIYQIRPNPVVDQLELVIDANESGMQKINLYSMTGELLEVMEYEVAKGQNIVKLNIDAGKFSTGVYFLNVTDDSKVLWNGRFVKF